MKRFGVLALALLLAASTSGAALGQAPPIESELAMITPVSKSIHDAALKAFADYAKEKWNVTVKVSAIPAGTPVAYGRIVEWKGRSEEHTSELQSRLHLVCRLLLEKKKCIEIRDSLGIAVGDIGRALVG